MHTEFAEALEPIAEAQSHALERCASHMRSGEIRERESVKNAGTVRQVRGAFSRKVGEQKQAIAPSEDGRYLFFKLSVA